MVTVFTLLSSSSTPDDTYAIAFLSSAVFSYAVSLLSATMLWSVALSFPVVSSKIPVFSAKTFLVPDSSSRETTSIFPNELRPSTLVVCTSCEQPVIIVAIIPMTTVFFSNFFFNIINLSISMINY